MTSNIKVKSGAASKAGNGFFENRDGLFVGLGDGGLDLIKLRSHLVVADLLPRRNHDRRVRGWKRGLLVHQKLFVELLALA